jgi:hypothetical protein
MILSGECAPDQTRENARAGWERSDIDVDIGLTSFRNGACRSP